MSEKKYVVGIGEALLDCFTKKRRKLGGAPTIFAYHAAQTGWKGMIVSAIGKDDDGKEIQDQIEKHNLQCSLKTIKDKPSGIVSVNNRDRNNPKYRINKNSAWSEIPYSNDLTTIAHNTKAVYFGLLASYCGKTSKNTIDRFLTEVPKNCLKVFDVNLRSNPDEKLYNDELILEYVNKCNVLKVNLDELEYLCKLLGITGGESKKCRAIMDLYQKLKFLIVTMGEDGSSVFWRDKEHGNKIAFSSLGMPVEVENTVGAGDALAGAFIGEILRKRTPVHAHRIAVQRATVVCKAGDSMPHIIRPDIFISYSRIDEYIVSNFFCKFFEEKGWSVWRDKRSIHHGEKFPPKIEQAIRNCEVVVYFSSKNANKSKWVTKEVKFARENNKKVIPIKLDDEPFNDSVKSLLKDIDHMDYALSRLVDSIEQKINS